MRPLDLFISPAAADVAIRAPYCAALNHEQAKRRGAPVAVKADDPFSQCPPLKDLVLLLGSTDRQRIDRVGLVADPYVAGPYAEGR
ncbi:hypothetical protein, partial [Clostridium perfringens]